MSPIPSLVQPGSESQGTFISALSRQAAVLVMVVAVVSMALAGVAAPAFADPPGASSIFKGSQNRHVVAGERALRVEQYDRAARHFEQALRRSMSEAERGRTLSNLCAAYTGAGRLNDALERCNESLELTGPSWQAYNNRGVVYLMAGRPEAAVAEFERALALRPGARGLERGLRVAQRRAQEPRSYTAVSTPSAAR